ncbi:thiolase-like protein [Artemisia annua]|uniref:arginine--tRNA ligase n=1 Tax=Artemisia annua TaxID=35608 RepID=A0A2U1Q608_ARTAN|nr:thiolase-like protein [Artemisia annua]
MCGYKKEYYHLIKNEELTVHRNKWALHNHKSIKKLRHSTFHCGSLIDNCSKNKPVCFRIGEAPKRCRSIYRQKIRLDLKKKKKRCEDKQEIEGCSLQEKYENLTSEMAASTSTIDGQRLEEIINGLGMHSFFSTSATEASTSTVEDEGYTSRLIEIASLVIHEGRRLRLEEIVHGLSMHSLFSTSAMAASTSTVADVQKEIKRWSFIEEISKPFDDSMKSRFSELEEYALIFASKEKEHGDFTCENVLSIWPTLRKERKMHRGPRDVGNRGKLKGPRDVGEEIKKNLPKPDLIMIEEGISIHDVGFITFSLSREWMAKDVLKYIEKQGNSFVYLLNTQARIRRITNDYCKDIDKLKKGELILEENAKWGEGEERVLEFHLLNFTEVLKESCTFVLPHMLCDYLYDLSKKYNNYYSSVCKFWQAGSVAETSTSTLLLCEATRVVIEKCFHLLGFTPTSSFFELSLTQLPPGMLFSAKRPMDISARDPPRNSRFELFSILPSVITDTVKEGKLFGLIAVSDNCGLLSDDGGFFLSEPDFAYVTLFNREWCNSIEMTDCELIYLGNPSCRHSAPFSSSIDIHMRLFVTATNKKKKDRCFQLCNKVIEIDTSDFWAEKSDAGCGYRAVKGVDGVTDLHYILLKNAVDSVMEVTFTSKTDGPKVYGYIFASYGDDFPYGCDRLSQRYYKALLFQPDPLKPLENDVIIPLRRSMLSVPLNGHLVIKAYLEEVKSGKVIIDGSYKFKSQCKESSVGVIKGPEGTNCSLNLKIYWKYQAQCPGYVNYINAQATSTLVNYINAQATSTLVGDLAEVNAVKKVFKKTEGIKMNATKSMIGHCLGAAGGLEAIATVKAIQTGWLHPFLPKSKCITHHKDDHVLVVNKPAHMEKLQQNRKYYATYDLLEIKEPLLKETSLLNSKFTGGRGVWTVYSCSYCICTTVQDVGVKAILFEESIVKQKDPTQGI